MRKIKRPVSMILSVCICLGMLISTLLASGVSKAFAADYTSELWLVDDVNHALVRGTRRTLSETDDLSPFQNDTGTMYLPVSIICEYTGASYIYENGIVKITLKNGSEAILENGSPSWTLNGAEKEDFLIPVVEKSGVPFISILMTNGIFGTYNYYNKAMGLVIFAEQPVTGYSSGYSSLKSQVERISSIIMDRPTGTQVYEDLEANVGATTHPRLFIDADKFAEFREVYASANSGDPYYEGIAAQYKAGVGAFNSHFIINENGEVEWQNEPTRLSIRQPHYLYDENGNRLVGQTSYTYTDPETGEEKTISLPAGCTGDGYDVGGRSNVNSYAQRLTYFAFAWQMTGESKYADAFYLYAKELDKWEHWGEGHFLNVADGSYTYAVAFDWIYHAFDNDTARRDELADILYRKGLMKGYYSIKYDGFGRTIQHFCDFSISARAGADSAWRTINRTNNWQTVCGAGMIVSALALAEYDEYRNDCTYVIENYIKSFEKCVWQFAPDGSYPESPTYWVYCVNTLMNTLIAFEKSCGRSYGYKDVIGLYESYYYAAGISDSDYNIWGYHDSGSGTIDASYFYLAAEVFDDVNLAAFRNTMVFDRGHSMRLADIAFYDASTKDVECSIPLDYNFAGIHTATFRSSLDSGATYAGLHVGPTVHDHSDFDTGNFILRMGGVEWCKDPGSEDYNVPGFWETKEGGRRFRLYRKSLEGHSSIVIHSSELPHGQKHVGLTGSFPVINTFYSDENGGYAISNMKTQYGSTCESAYRGVLMTNSRRTVVLQDEINFSSPTSLTWVLNLMGNIEISNDGRSLTSTVWENGHPKTTIRLTMLTDDESLTFRRLKNGETVLSNTITKENSGQPLACDTEQRVVIEANNVTNFNVAVVFDILKHKDEAVGYEKLPMSEWTTSDDEWLNDANADIIYPGEEPIYKYQASHFARANSDLAKANGDFAKIGEILAKTAVYLTDYDKKNPTVMKEVEQYLQYLKRYNYEVDKINQAFKDIYLGTMPAPSL